MNTGETIALIKAFGNGGGGSSLPAVTPSDNGKVLAVEDGAWAAQQKKFIVTLTPTAQDFSGTMDKTMGEISAAYEAGCDIVFRLITSQNGSHVDVPVSSMDFSNDDETPFYVFHAYFIYNDMLIEAYNIEIGPQSNTYSTAIYTLTPAS